MTDSDPNPNEGSRPSPASPAMTVELGEDWAAQTADAIDRIVGTVRDRTAVPATSAARWVVYGLVAAFVGLIGAVLSAIALVRVLDDVLPGEVWSAHALTGGIFFVVGLLLWTQRRPTSTD